MNTTTKLGTRRNSSDSIFRIWKIEGRLHSWPWNKGELALPILVTLTTLALRRYDAACQEYVERKTYPYTWPIYEEERCELRTLRQRYPAGWDTAEMAESILNKLLVVATIDE